MRFSRQHGIVVGILAILCGLAGTDAVRAQAAGPIGVVDVNEIMNDSATGRAAQEEFRQLLQAKQQEGDRLQQEIQALQEQLAQGRLSLSEERLSELRQQLEEKQIAWQRFQTDSQRQLQTKQAETLRQLEAQILPVIQQVGADGGYSMIFNKFDSGLLYVDAAVEITDEVLARLGTAEGSGATEGSATSSQETDTGTEGGEDGDG